MAVLYLELWHRTRQLRHSNLIELIDCGRADHGGETVCYAVFESSRRKPSPQHSAGRRSIQQEAREVLDSVLEALRYPPRSGAGARARWIQNTSLPVGDRIQALDRTPSATPPPRPPTGKRDVRPARQTSGRRLSMFRPPRRVRRSLPTRRIQTRQTPLGLCRNQWPP